VLIEDRCQMELQDVTKAVLQTAWNLPPARLGRFLVATVVPGEYARDVRRRHEQAQRLHDEGTLRVLASVALRQSISQSPNCRREAELVLRAFCQQSDATLDEALDPHAAAVTRALLGADVEPVEVAMDPTGQAPRIPAATVVAHELPARRQTRTPTADTTGRLSAQA
jgi:hypothetical protein